MCYSLSSMFLLIKPSEDRIRRFIASQRDLPFSYPDVGATLASPPAGFTLDHNRIEIGRGEDVFSRATVAIRQWKMFGMPWIRLCWPISRIEVGVTVAVLARHLGFFSLNACRIVSVIDTDDGIKKFGFAYGTLPDHAERGEERFMVEWNRETDTVSYDLLAFSQPGHFLAKLGYPVARRLQKKFAAASKRAMFEAVNIRG
ncbi:MAG: DUF1990 domain-containing protein [Acidobacteriota bacterium]